MCLGPLPVDEAARAGFRTHRRAQSRHPPRFADPLFTHQAHQRFLDLRIANATTATDLDAVSRRVDARAALRRQYCAEALDWRERHSVVLAILRAAHTPRVAHIAVLLLDTLACALDVDLERAPLRAFGAAALRLADKMHGGDDAPALSAERAAELLGCDAPDALLEVRLAAALDWHLDVPTALDFLGVHESAVADRCLLDPRLTALPSAELARLIEALYRGEPTDPRVRVAALALGV
jgi:hypothetical protein